MPMTLTVPDEIVHTAQELAASTGDSAENLLLQTQSAHFPPISPELQADDFWERMSDETMRRFNEQEDLRWREKQG